MSKGVYFLANNQVLDLVIAFLNSDAALAKLPDFPSLKELLPMAVTDDGFRHIGRCQQLESLILMYCRETGDVATSHIAGMANLRKYHAGYTLMTDRSLEMLGRMNSLEELSFEGCKFISDAGIRFLTTLPRLREISIGGCPRVTRAGVTGFAASVDVNYDTVSKSTDCTDCAHRFRYYPTAAR
jgi:F-box/leucine-rich repeat protein 14